MNRITGIRRHVYCTVKILYTTPINQCTRRESYEVLFTVKENLEENRYIRVRNTISVESQAHQASDSRTDVPVRTVYK